MAYPIRIRLATNSHLTLLRCEREFELVELLQGNSNDDVDNNPTLTFGKAWGEGIMEYLVTEGNIDAAVRKAWQAYYPVVEEMDRGWQEEFCYHGLKVAKSTLDKILEDWQVATFNGKPAVELAFRININDAIYYESSMDGVLKHRREGYHATIENKHTLTWVDDITPMYKNSAQGVSYSLVLDKVVGQPLSVIPIHYIVGQFTKADGLHKPRIHHFRWKKTLLDRLNWFLSLGMDAKHIQEMIDIGIFPMRGHSCRRFNTVCPFFGTCHIRSGDKPKTPEYVEKNKSAHVKEVESSVQFVFSLDEIVADHLQRVQEVIK